jgi:hypothetical protein
VVKKIKYSPRKGTEGHGKRKIAKIVFGFSAAGGLIIPCGSVKNPW